MYNPRTSHRRSKGRNSSMLPSQLRYTHDIISRRFRTENKRDFDSAPEGPKLEETFEKLVRNPNFVNTLPSIPVMHVDGSYWAVNGNRRLILYKKLQELDLVRTVPVTIEPYDEEWFDKAYSTETDGKSVQIHGISTRQFDYILNEVYRKVQREKGPREASWTSRSESPRLQSRRYGDGSYVGQYESRNWNYDDDDDDDDDDYDDSTDRNRSRNRESQDSPGFGAVILGIMAAGVGLGLKWLFG